MEELAAVRQTLQTDLETSIRRIADLQAALEEVASSDSDTERYPARDQQGWAQLGGAIGDPRTLRSWRVTGLLGMWNATALVLAPHYMETLWPGSPHPCGWASCISDPGLIPLPVKQTKSY